MDSYFLRSKSQSIEVQQQVKKQSLKDINNPVPAEEEKDTGEKPEPSPVQPTEEKKIQEQKQQIK